MNRRDFLAATGAAALAASALPVWSQTAGKKITLALVGVAHLHTSGYVGTLKMRDDVSIKYVWDPDPKLAEQWAKEANAQPVTDLKTIWADAEIVGVVILSETNRHHELVLAGAKAGKSLFVEKPLGVNGSEAREMADAIEKAGVLFTTGYTTRTDAKHLFIKDEIAKGNFGTITRVRASNCLDASLKGWFDKDCRWMADPKIAGVGAFGDLGTHKVDILMWLLGDVAAVTGDFRNVTHRYGDADETGEALLRFKNGVIATIAAGWVDIEDPVKLQICGTEGTAVIFNEKLYYRSEKVETSDNRKPMSHLPPGPKLPIQQFVDALLGDRNQPLVTAREAASRVQVMEAIYRAAQSHTWVDIV